jgi:rhodanese-related sulfurtransferase
MTVKNNPIFKGVYNANNPVSDYEMKIEKIRSKLPDEFKELGLIVYSSPFTVDDKETIKMNFETEISNFFQCGRISYLVLASDNSYDFEGTTYWDNSYEYTNWNNPFSVYEFIISCLKNGVSDCNVIKAEQAKNIIDLNEDGIIIDVRSKESYNSNYIFESISIPSTDASSNIYLQNIIKEYSNKCIIIYGENDFELRKAFEVIAELGFTDVYTLKDCIDDCIKAGFLVFSTFSK